MLSDDSASQKRLATTLGGSYFALGVGGAATGRGAHLLLIDDPSKGREEADSETYRRRLKDWYRSVAYTRLMPGGAVIIILTRWHHDDLAGWLLREHSSEGWEVLSLPAIADSDSDMLGRKIGDALWPAKYPVSALEKIREQTGSRDWSALYQQQPSPDEGGVFRVEWFGRFTALPQHPRLLVHSWDTGIKDSELNDPSSCTIWHAHDNGYYLADRFNQRLQFPDLLRASQSLAARDNPHYILIEDKGSGQQLLQVLQRETRLPVVGCKANESKIARAQSVSGIIEAGHVYLPQMAPWLTDYETELANFPTGVHDDDVDSTTQALRFLSDKMRALKQAAVSADIRPAGAM